MNATPTYRTVEVTPEIAAKWLTDNTHNRPINERIVAAYAGAMSRGEWRENGDCIRFSKPPRVLLDGQKRLAAVVASDCTVAMLVVEGLDHQVQTTIDVGQRRSFSNTLKLMGETEATDMAATTTRLYYWQTGQFQGHNRYPTFAQLLELHSAHGPALRESVRVAKSVRRQIPAPGSILALAHFLFVDIDAPDCDFFFARLRDGQAISEGDPLYALRKMLINNRASSPSRGGYTHEMLLALLIKAWNAYRSGESVRVIYWRAGGSCPESFPTPK